MATDCSGLIRSKFRGCLYGVLLGDCLGAPYEGEEVSDGEKIIIQRYFDKLQEDKFIGPYRQYTDDTAMTKSVAKFLVDKPEPDYQLLAKLFVKEYYKEPNRGYGQNVVEVFLKLKNSKYVDIFKPAGEQFWGSGSYGNGGAMRIAPVALYYYDDYERMLDVAQNVTRITHTNKLGINGALLQCIAIQQSLMCNPEDGIEPIKFCQELQEKIAKIEKSEPGDDDCDSVPEETFERKLQVVESFLKRENQADIDEEVIFELGNGINAYESVVTAIYCFLRAQREIPTVQTDNLFRRTIQYAITLGGDTDTIASMAGAIAGAFVGEDGIDKDLIEQCEFSKQMKEIADNLFTVKQKSP